jgi:hypothetical protein
MESYHALRLVDMPISVVSMFWVFSTTESLLLSFPLESTQRATHVEF